jgi:hypothetical protein
MIAMMISAAGCRNSGQPPKPSHENAEPSQVAATKTKVVQHSLLNLWQGKLKAFKCDTFIKAAADLQALGEDGAIKFLSSLAPTRLELVTETILCNMLFEPPPRSNSRGPRFTAAKYMGETNEAQWPLEPIELVDGVPFLVVKAGSWTGGLSEDAAALTVQWFVDNWRWRAMKYVSKTQAEKESALTKLKASMKWVRPLADDEWRFLADQVRP